MAQYHGAMSVSRGKFLKSLGKSIPGMVLGSGMGLAAEKLLARVAAADGALPEAPVASSPQAPAQAGAGVPFVREGPAEGNRIALTFDDGPTLGVTDLILDVLKERKLRATFFMIGKRVAESPELARRVLAEGHEVGNHTFTHANLTQLSDTAAEREIADTQAVMAERLQHRPTWFRPPYGSLRPSQGALAQAAGLRVALWSVDSRDWAQPGEVEIVQRIQYGAKAGSIILCHDLYPQTAHCLPKVIDELVKRKFSFSTLSELVPA